MRPAPPGRLSVPRRRGTLGRSLEGEPAMRTRAVLLATLSLVWLDAAAGRAGEAPRYDRRWVYAQYNLLVDKNVEQVLSQIERAARSGYTGRVLADYKFNVLDRLRPKYFKNVARVRQAADAAGVELIPTVCPIGYSAGLLAHDPNLAEGVPVKAAP